MYKKLISFALSLILAFSVVGIMPVYAEECNDTNPYSKLHFYCNANDQETVNNEDELRTALEAAKSSASPIAVCSDLPSDGNASGDMMVTVEFKSDFMNTEQ